MRAKRIEYHPSDIKYPCVICGSDENLISISNRKGCIDISDQRCSEYYCPLVICEKCARKLVEALKQVLIPR